MSTARDIVHRLNALVVAIAELLETETAKQAPEIAVQLGAEAQLNQAIDLLVRLLRQLRDGVARLRDPLRQVAALRGLLGLMRPFLSAAERVVNISGDTLAQAGLKDVVVVTGPVSDGVAFGGRILDSGQAVLAGAPRVEDLDALLGSLDGLAATLISRKAPAPGTAGAAVAGPQAAAGPAVAGPQPAAALPAAAGGVR
jgi:hypothetical protein